MPFELPSPVSQALSRLNAAGFSAYAVGGCVRDWFLGLTPHDYDICTSAYPEEMKRVFAADRTIETGIRHGTLTVLLDDMPLEITTFRVDGAYLDGRHPTSVQFTPSVEADLARRDFTINAMAYHPAEGFIDPFHGQDDCRAGLIRCVGDPARRFQEDALRMLRALRFSARLGFPIVEETAQAIFQLYPHLECISKERIAAELSGLLLADHCEAILACFAPVLFFLLPALKNEDWPRVLSSIALLPPSLPLRFAGLMQGCSASCAETLLRDLRLPNALTDAVATLIAWQSQTLSSEKIQWLMMKLGPERARQLLLFQRAQKKAAGNPAADTQTQTMLLQLDALEAQQACYSLKQLRLNGRDLAALGYQGAAIGQELNRLLEKVTLGQLPNETQALLLAAKSDAQ